MHRTSQQRSRPHIEEAIVGELSVHILNFARVVVLTAWKGIDVQAIV
jgi:hypothetical protein